VIIDHYKRPRNRGDLEGATAHGRVFSPLCGDEMIVHVRLSGDTIEACTFGGKGCAICQAAASLMTEAVTGRTVPEAKGIERLVRRMAIDPTAELPESLGDLSALREAARIPSRRACVVLSWDALALALAPRPPLR
jgi:nitrogen fixation NifU-like protein